MANVVFGNYEDHLYVDIINCGIGPLIIETVIVKNENGEEKGNIVEFMPELPKGQFWSNHVQVLKGRAISPADRINLIRLRTNLKVKQERTTRHTIRAALGLLTLTVVYKDVFGKEIYSETRSLDYFKVNSSND